MVAKQRKTGGSLEKRRRRLRVDRYSARLTSVRLDLSRRSHSGRPGTTTGGRSAAYDDERRRATGSSPAMVGNELWYSVLDAVYSYAKTRTRRTHLGTQEGGSGGHDGVHRKGAAQLTPARRTQELWLKAKGEETRRCARLTTRRRSGEEQVLERLW
jgi:hypothetical protein